VSECTAKLIRIVQDVKAPFTLEVVRSIARLCNEDPYRLWYSLATSYKQRPMPIEVSAAGQRVASEKKPTTTGETCWRCSACGKSFDDIKHLVNHILFFLRQGDKAHAELYKEVKSKATKEGKTFTQVAEELLRC